MTNIGKVKDSAFSQVYFHCILTQGVLLLPWNAIEVADASLAIGLVLEVIVFLQDIRQIVECHNVIICAVVKINQFNNNLIACSDCVSRVWSR